MKKMLLIVSVFGLLGLGLLAGCQKQADTTTAPAAPSTNAPATTNAPAQ